MSYGKIFFVILFVFNLVKFSFLIRIFSYCELFLLLVNNLQIFNSINSLVEYLMDNFYKMLAFYQSLQRILNIHWPLIIGNENLLANKEHIETK